MPIVLGEGVVPKQEDEAQTDAARRGSENEPGRQQVVKPEFPEQPAPRHQMETGDWRRPVRRVHRHGHGRRVRQ